MTPTSHVTMPSIGAKYYEFATRLAQALDRGGVKASGRICWMRHTLDCNQLRACHILEGDVMPDEKTLTLLAKQLGTRQDWLRDGQGTPTAGEEAAARIKSMSSNLDSSMGRAPSQGQKQRSTRMVTRASARFGADTADGDVQTEAGEKCQACSTRCSAKGHQLCHPCAHSIAEKMALQLAGQSQRLDEAELRLQTLSKANSALQAKLGNLVDEIMRQAEIAYLGVPRGVGDLMVAPDLLRTLGQMAATAAARAQQSR